MGNLREVTQPFYSSGAWKACADAYKNAHPLCERCLKKHEISVAEEVHHKIRLTASNINDADVALNWDNLEALCEKCHKKEHPKGKKREKRWNVGEDGNVEVYTTPPLSAC